MSTRFVNVPVPAELASFFKWPPLLVTESRGEYEALFKAFADELKPKSTFEYLLFKDILESIWEIRRLKNSKSSLIDLARKTALHRVLESIAEGDAEQRHRFAEEKTVAWFKSIEEQGSIGVLLQKHGLREQDIDAQAMAMRLPELEIIDRQLERARANQTAMLRQFEYLQVAGPWRISEKLAQIVDTEAQAIPLVPADPKPAIAK